MGLEINCYFLFDSYVSGVASCLFLFEFDFDSCNFLFSFEEIVSLVWLEWPNEPSL